MSAGADNDEREKAIEALGELRKSVQSTSICAEQIIESCRLSAKFLRARYLALVEEGFSHSESLEIIKARGLT